MYVLDTDVCIDIMRGKPKAVERAQRESPADLFVSSMTLAELAYGSLRSSDPASVQDRIDAFFSASIEILPFGENTALLHAQIRAALSSHPIGERDLVIASTALEHGLILATGNTREFTRVPGLAIENWIR